MRAAIVRAMPNTPAAVRQGVTVACPGAGVDAAQRALCERLLTAIGVVAWVEDEALLDPVTAVSGSGPAYVFLLAELMEQAAIEQGIPPDLARLLARQTVSGLRRAAGRQRRGRGGVARCGHQSGGHHRAGAVGADGAGRLAGGAEPRDRRGDGAVARIGGVTRRGSDITPACRPQNSPDSAADIAVAFCWPRGRGTRRARCGLARHTFTVEAV